MPPTQARSLAGMLLLVGCPTVPSSSRRLRSSASRATSLLFCLATLQLRLDAPLLRYGTGDTVGRLGDVCSSGIVPLPQRHLLVQQVLELVLELREHGRLLFHDVEQILQRPLGLHTADVSKFLGALEFAHCQLCIDRERPQLVSGCVQVPKRSADQHAKASGVVNVAGAHQAIGTLHRGVVPDIGLAR